jgi:hypothetical protein
MGNLEKYKKEESDTLCCTYCEYVAKTREDRWDHWAIYHTDAVEMLAQNELTELSQDKNNISFLIASLPAIKHYATKFANKCPNQVKLFAEIEKFL